MRHGLMFVALLGLIALASCGEDGTNSTDTTDPQITILAPAANANVVVGDVLIRAEATDNVAVEKVEFYAGATLLGEDSTGSAGVYEHTWDTTGLTSGSVHQIRARAIDTTGNDTYATISVTICPAGTSVHSDNITTDETWYACWNPHTVTASFSVWQGGTLTIEPGCIIQFVADAAIYCASDGAIIADGAPGMPILFTSDETVPSRGDWAGLDIQSTQPETHFGYCTIEFAGAADGQAVYVAWGGVLRMDHSIIRNSAGRGIYYEHGGHVEQFNNNTITDCADYPLALDADYVRHLGVGNDYTGNDSGYDAIEIYGGGVETSGTWRNQGVPYRITEGSEVWVGDQVTPIILTIEAGTTIEFEPDAGMTIGYLVFAGLIAEGTIAAPITFTSAADSPNPGDWRQIWIADASVDAQSRLSHCVIEYGGGQDFGNLLVSDALPQIEDCTIRHSSTYGIYLNGVVHLNPATLESQNEFNDNASGDVVWVE
ncbi:MAG: Ig-like domain-containing protein [Deltaproteobacteria bacterium]|nr:Ig-like domain-containing protein [Deltaproteobacteria bacterium]